MASEHGAGNIPNIETDLVSDDGTSLDGDSAFGESIVGVLRAKVKVPSRVWAILGLAGQFPKYVTQLRGLTVFHMTGSNDLPLERYDRFNVYWVSHHELSYRKW
jgi:hypothetical protein